ncbi:DNA-binding transcriptional regulator, MarR family [Desulfacinum hydrothermale DSM 13146]|uniref:DNA-binding transcriptional regulator, MarR family n=1 Tax=Desulfacinum hydrothermale DSM 13146 TaxID=1121390 RepID=A0A1W1XNI7_9BACT|nr:MarR family transcriptional regulator [Desulfacinum hydrothermale]SMC25539.1 DNA-binding transcriptional regulator, MarR family [Desulfacinum hydrothermale DSM 13146]
MRFEDCLCFQLACLSRSLSRTYRDRIAPHGLTQAQFFMLIALYEEDGAPPSRLSQKTRLDRPTVTGLLDRLERDGWVERRSDPADRRSLRVFLTAKAWRHQESLCAVYEEVNGLFMEKFSPEEWQAFRAFLDRLRDDH